MANLITMSRIILAIITVCLLFIPTTPVYIAAFVLTAIVIWFDGLDGYLARKFNASSKFGALFDIMGDRIVENVFWISFSALGWINVCVPVIVLTRGIVTDSLRTLAFEKGYTAFGATTMQQNKIAKFIVASNFVRFTYAVCKAFAFALLIAAKIPTEYNGKEIVATAAYICVYVSVFLCVIRGIPVLVESRRFFTEDEK